MTAAAIAQKIFRPVVGGRVQVEPMNVTEYHRLIESGDLPEDTSIELLNGFLTYKDRSAAGEDPMSIGDPHRVSVTKLMNLGSMVTRFGAFLQVQQPVTFQPKHEPEPDAAIIRGVLEDFMDHAPGASDIFCIVEVSDNSLRNDRTVKLELYASQGIRQYIIVNLPDRVVEAYANPSKASSQYRKKQVLRSTETLVVQFGKGKTLNVPVKQLLP